MKNYFLLILVFSFCVVSNTQSDQGMLSKLYGCLLGNQNVSPDYQVQVKKALSSFNVNPETVAIKQMNGVGPAFARVNLSSFTAFGIWLNEKFLNTLSNEEKTFQLYHEAAHYTQKHHQKILLGSAIIFPIIGLMFKKLNDCLKSNSIKPATRYTTLATSALIICAGLYFCILPKIIKNQEKNADLLAAQALLNSGESTVLDEHLKELQRSLLNSEPSTNWWYSIQEQIDYLQKVKK